MLVIAGGGRKRSAMWNEAPSLQSSASLSSLGLFPAVAYRRAFILRNHGCPTASDPHGHRPGGPAAAAIPGRPAAQETAGAGAGRGEHGRHRIDPHQLAPYAADRFARLLGFCSLPSCPLQYRELFDTPVERLHALRDALVEQMEAGLAGRVRLGGGR